MPPRAEVFVATPNFDDHRNINLSLEKAGHRVVGGATNSWAALRQVQRLSEQGGAVDVLVLNSPLAWVPFSVPDERFVAEFRQLFPEVKVVGMNSQPETISGVDVSIDTRAMIKGELARIVTEL